MSKKITPIRRRLIANAATMADGTPEEITYQHTVLCQTCMPYRDPGDTVRQWERSQGSVRLRIEAGSALEPATDRFVNLGLPCGPKARLVIMHLNDRAIKTQSPTIEVEDSLTAFVKGLGLAGHGRDINIVKDQLTRLSAATIRLAVARDNRALQINTQIVTACDLWFPKNERQRVFWPSTVRLSEEYFQSLARHAVPLKESAISVLSHTAMGLDIYTWLAQRLHRIPIGKPQFVPWTSVRDQFGDGYKRIRKFREKFIAILGEVRGST